MCEVQIVLINREKENGYELRLSGYSNAIEQIDGYLDYDQVMALAERFAKLLQWKIVKYSEETEVIKTLKKL